MDVTAGDEICGRCLVNLDSRSVIMALWSGGGRESAHSMQPAALKKWAQDMLYGNHASFHVDDAGARFEAISTWHGDPVCSYHLWLLAEAEMRRGYG